jgi:translation initiation factor IF-1
MSKELIELTGAVTEVLPNNTYRVKVDNMEHIMLCYLGGRLKQHKIKIILGDKVKIETSSYDLTKGRVTYRL